MPRFDVYRNPNPRASHVYYLDVQSDLVTTAARWCIPVLPASPEMAVVARAQVVLALLGDSHVVDTPNILAVPSVLLCNPLARVGSRERSMVEAAIEFMLRGY